MHHPSISLSVIVPVFNSQETLEALIQRLEPVLRQSTSQYEVILVNDGSRDKSWNLITQLAAQQHWIRGIDLMRNYGQHNALLCGIRAARHSIVITMDDDLQNPPEEIPVLLEELSRGYDAVYGEAESLRHGFLRDCASRMIKMSLRVSMGSDIAGKVSAFRAFRTDLREGFARYESPFVSIDVLLSWATSKFSAVKVRHDARKSGTSNYTFFKLVGHAITMLTGFSEMPLRLASMAGFFLTLFGFAILLYVLGRYFLLGGSVPGFPFLASLIAIFSGAQMFAIGIMGEYLARIHKRTMDRPVYVVRTHSDSIDESLVRLP